MAVKGGIYLVPNVGQRDVVVDLDGLLVVHEEIEDVGDCGGNPTAALIEELVETFGAVSVGVRRGRVFDSVATLKKKCAQPSIFALKLNANIFT
jgi:hypothetical protein